MNPVSFGFEMKGYAHMDLMDNRTPELSPEDCTSIAENLGQHAEQLLREALQAKQQSTSSAR